MARQITFYTNPQSRGVMVHWMLEEVGATYDIRLLSLEKGEQRSPEFLSVNPMGKVPVLVVDGIVVTETPAIIAWLGDAFPDAGLAPPPGSPERGAWYRWLFFGGGCIEPALVGQLTGRGDGEPNMATGWGNYDAVVDTLERTLADRAYLLGDRFGAADLYVAAELWWGGMFGAPRIKESEVLQSYVARCIDREAYRRVMGGDPGAAA